MLDWYSRLTQPTDQNLLLTPETKGNIVIASFYMTNDGQRVIRVFEGYGNTPAGRALAISDKTRMIVSMMKCKKTIGPMPIIRVVRAESFD